MPLRIPRAVLAVAVAALALAGCGGSDPPDPTGTGDPTGAPPTGAPGVVPGGGLGEAPAPPQAATSGTVAVYYLGEEEIATEAGPSTRLRLYREFQRLEVGDGSSAARVTAAVGRMLTPGSALDPDYHGGWPASAAVRSVQVASGTATVDLSGAASHSVGAEGTVMAVQQLIWTATADPAVDNVTLLLDGAPIPDLWGHVGIGPRMPRGPVLDTVALLWLISPQHGQEVATTFEVHVYGAVFEATAQLRVRQGATVVHDQLVSLGGSGFPEFFGEAKVDLTLPPGTYTVEVFELSALDGSEIRLDDKVVIVG
jgi:hypothetical protein